MGRRLDSVSGRFAVAGSLLRFFWSQRLWWMIPLVAILLFVGVLLWVGQQTAVAPFIYALF